MTEQLALIDSIVEQEFSGLGLEHHPFKIGWYNSLVAEHFRLDYHPDTLGVVVLSTPDMFEWAFLPFVRRQRHSLNQLTDPIDQCMQFHLECLKKKLNQYQVDVIHDFELRMPSRRPKVLVQTAAHVSGAAFFYRPVAGSDSASTANGYHLIGVCLHPSFGGWFAIRAVLVFRHLLVPALQRVEPRQTITSRTDIDRLIHKFNLEWQDWTYRDVVPVAKRYSDLQMKYFGLKPGERFQFIDDLLGTADEAEEIAS